MATKCLCCQWAQYRTKVFKTAGVNRFPTPPLQ